MKKIVSLAFFFLAISFTTQASIADEFISNEINIENSFSDLTSIETVYQTADISAETFLLTNNNLVTNFNLATTSTELASASSIYRGDNMWTSKPFLISAAAGFCCGILGGGVAVLIYVLGDHDKAEVRSSLIGAGIGAGISTIFTILYYVISIAGTVAASTI